MPDSNVVAFPVQHHAALPRLARQIFEAYPLEQRSDVISFRSYGFYERAMARGVPRDVAHAQGMAVAGELIKHIVRLEREQEPAQAPLARR
jgi:hypothetical protein